VSDLPALYESEIYDYLKFIPFFKGVFPRDKIESINVNRNKNFAFVLNLEDSSKGGSHWTCSYYDSTLPYVEYYDSYGLEPPLEFEKLIAKKIKKPIKYNPYQHQLSLSVRCGYYTINYIIKRYSGMSSDAFMSKLTKNPSNKNERFAISF
jgi:hypothetical protein